MKTPKKVTKRQMWKLGCAGTVFSTLNHEFGFPILAEEKATANFGGGLNQSGRQCGLLWGSSMAAGAEAHRQSKDPDEALGKAILTTKQLINSYSSKTGSPNCREVTGCNPSTPLGLTKYMLLAKPLACMKLAGDWVSEAYEVIRGGISEEPTIPGGCKSCASEVAKKMGANEEEVAMVAGFTTLGRMLQVSFSRKSGGQKTGMMAAKTTREDLLFLKERMEAGQLKPVIDRIHPLEKTPDAIAYLEKKHARGKVIIRME